MALRQARLGIIWDGSPCWLKGSSPSPQVREAGDDIRSSHLQVQGGIKMTYQETSPPPQPFFFPFHTWQNQWLPSLNKAILPHPIHVLCLDSSIWRTKTKVYWEQWLLLIIASATSKPAKFNISKPQSLSHHLSNDQTNKSNAGPSSY
jgi:hypothetical protein